MVRTGPRKASGGTMALMREPSARRASTMGEDSSIRRPTAATIRSMMRRYCWFELKTTSVRSIRPLRSIQISSYALHMIFRDGPVSQQHLERAVAEGVLEHLLDEALALDGRDPDVLALEDLVDGASDLRLASSSGERSAARGAISASTFACTLTLDWSHRSFDVDRSDARRRRLDGVLGAAVWSLAAAAVGPWPRSSGHPASAGPSANSAGPRATS